MEVLIVGDAFLALLYVEGQLVKCPRGFSPDGERDDRKRGQQARQDKDAASQRVFKGTHG